MAKVQPIKSKRRVGLALQGGGSAGAFTAGVLKRILQDDSIEITHITGTSAGALNGYIVTQAINKYGYDSEGRQIAQKRLDQAWDSLSTPFGLTPQQDLCMQFARMVNPFLDSALKHGFSNMLKRKLHSILHNPNALQMGTPIKLTINSVDQNGQHVLFSGNELTPDAVLASAALPGLINPVKIGNSYFRDGACFGGANPPIQPLWNNQNDLDAVICVMTNIPEHPIAERLQSDLKWEDVEDTDGLILHQVFNEIAHSLSSHPNIPMHVIMPRIKTPWNKRDKQDTSHDTMTFRKKMGVDVADEFLNAHGVSLDTDSSVTLEDLRRIASQRQHLVAA